MRHARYARLYDGIINHKKFVGIDAAAGWLWTLSLAYCHDQLTDGHVPTVQPARLLGCAPKRAVAVAQLLVARGLWEVEPGGWLVHDYLEWNDSKADVLAEQARQAERKRRQRHGARHAGQARDVTRDRVWDGGTESRAQSSTEQYRIPPNGPHSNGGPAAGWRQPLHPGGPQRPPIAWLHDDGCVKAEHREDVPVELRTGCPAHR